MPPDLITNSQMLKQSTKFGENFNMNSLRKIGDVPAVHSSNVKHSSWGLGFEKLDRAVFDPVKAYDKVAALGVKHLRIQSGWARTEQREGELDFRWLDDIVENLLRRGLEPWICLCYGNGLYDDAAREVFGAVGCPPIHTEHQKSAWRRYVTSLTARYRNRVSRFEIWNEPDGIWCWKHGISGTEYALFARETASAIRAGSPEAEVIGGAICRYDYSWLADFLATGVAAELDAISYHCYNPDELDSIATVRRLRGICQRENPKLRFLQGETGAQSREGGAGALCEGAWTQERQAKFLARMLLSHFAEGVEINSYFSCLDMIEALNGKVGDTASYLDYGYFGVLGAEFDADGRSTGEYQPKMSYRTLQTLAAIFREEIVRMESPVHFLSGLWSPRLLRNDDTGDGDVLSFCFRKPAGTGFVYWKAAELLSSSYLGSVSLEMVGIPGEAVLVDLLDGSIYEIPPEAIETKPGTTYRRFLHLPLRDSPLLLAFGNFVGGNESGQ